MLSHINSTNKLIYYASAVTLFDLFYVHPVVARVEGPGSNILKVLP